MRPFWETQRATFIRAVYSRRQLKEVLADFWHNHFNVFGDDSIQGPMFVHYDRDVIRANMLGNFRTMLEAVASSTGMMYMLDNYTSSVAGPNENFARELFELHTLGAENYLGVMRQDDVPVDPQGRPIGYVDADVFEATRCFTGWSVANGQSGAPNTGALPLPVQLARPLPEARAQGLHPPGPARPRGRQHGARHPGRAPGHRPLRLPQAVPPADRRHAQPGHGGRGGAGVLRPARGTRPAAAGGARDPAVGGVPRHLGHEGEAPLRGGGERHARGGGAVPVRPSATATPTTFLWLYGNTGQQLFSRRSPDGYPDKRAVWMAPNPRVGSWRLCTWLMNEPGGSHFYLDVVAQTPASVRSANQITDYWIDRVFGRPLSAADRSAAVTFMAQGLDPTMALPWNDSVKNRVRALVGLLFWSPEFLYR